MESIHLAIVFFTLVVVVYSDVQGIRYMLGNKERLEKRAVAREHFLVSFGLALILITGGIMFSDRVSYLLSEPKFIIKMCFVGALVVNGYFIGVLSHIASEQPFKDLQHTKKMQLLLSGGISTVSWIAATLLGLSMTYFS